MFRDGEILEIKCPACNKIKKIKWHNKKDFFKNVSKFPGELSSDIKCECGKKIELPE